MTRKQSKLLLKQCPVDCIHYVPYDKLKTLEIELRDQNINFKGRLVNQSEYGGGVSHRVGEGVVSLQVGESFQTKLLTSKMDVHDHHPTLPISKKRK
jgi:hypothetical protein